MDDRLPYERDGQPGPEITVILGDDDAGTRAGARRALESAGVQVVAEAASAQQAVAAALQHKPAVCLLAVHMPGSGIVATAQITAALPDTKIVMLTGSDRDDDLFAAVRAGADGYLLKTTSAARLSKAIEGVLSGEAAIPRRLVARLLQDYRSRGLGRILRLSGSDKSVEVTAREFEVMSLLREGESTAEIARDLHISEVTVRRHISTVEHKLEAPNRRTAVALMKTAALEVPADTERARAAC
ncbi:MAG: response regulator [Solirubrobacteraceae bacterium]